MGRSRYKFYGLHYPYFITSSVAEGLPLFMNPDITNIILRSLVYFQQKNKVILNYSANPGLYFQSVP